MSHPIESESRLLTPRQLADKCGVGIHTIRNWRFKKTGPAFITIANNVVRYDPKDVNAWLASVREAV